MPLEEPAPRLGHLHRQMVESSPDLMSVVGVDYRYQVVSNSYLRFGRSQRKVVGRTVSEVHGEEVFQISIKPLLDRCFAGETVEEQHWIEPSPGTRRFLDVKHVPLRDPDGAISGAIIYTRDITSFKEAEEGLARYERMVAATEDLMVFVDDGYRFRAVNDRFLQAFKKTRAEVLGQRVEDVMGEPLFRGILEPRLTHGLLGKRLSTQTWLELPGIGKRCLDARYAPHVADDGRVNGVVATIRDVTTRQRRQDELLTFSGHESVAAGDRQVAAEMLTKRTGEALEIERVSIWLLDEERERLRCEALYLLSAKDYRRGEELAVTNFPIYFQKLQSSKVIEMSDARNDPATREFRDHHLVPNGICSMLDAPIRVAGEWLGVVSHEHVGEEPRSWQADEVSFALETANTVAQVLMNRRKKALEDRLRQAQKMESLGVLAGGIAHDFNNLLVGILGSADLALDSLGEDSPTAPQLRLITQAAERASDLCAQLLAYAGKRRLSLCSVDLSQEVQEIAEVLSLGENTDLQFRFAEDLPKVEVDITQVRQVFMNLLTNASDAMADAGGTILVSSGTLDYDPEVGVTEGLSSELDAGLYAFVEVTDTGCGIDNEIRAKMFDPFFTTKFTGRGLGLAAVLGIVRGHGGALSIESDVGEGTSIRVYFPVPEQEIPVREKGGEVQVDGGSGNLILVVDDEEMVRLVAYQILSHKGYRVVTANDGLEGLNTFREQSDEIAAVLLDITMPVMGGEEALLEMQKIDPHARVILSSGFSEEDAAERFSDVELAGFLQKPYRATKLIEMIEDAIRPG